MGKLDWYRRTTWTENDCYDFFSHLNRCRKDNRAQYLRIQAYSLSETNQLQEISAALDLINLALKEEKYEFEQAGLLNLKAECLNKQGNIREAEECFNLAIQELKNHAEYREVIAFSFGLFVIQHKIMRLYRKAIMILDEFVNLKTTLLFPSTVYTYFGIEAIIYHRTLKRKVSKRFAKIAIEASKLTYSGLPRHPDVGLVTNKDDFFYSELIKIAS